MKYLLTAALVFCMAAPAMAVLGLPVADDGQTEAGLLRASGGATFESDMNLYGLRLSYGVTDKLAFFGGAGLFDPDFGDTEPYLQLGGTYALDIADLPFNLAARVAFGITSYDYESGYGSYAWKAEADLWTLNAGLLGSKTMDMITFYGLIGVSYQKLEADFTETTPAGRETFSASDSETELAVVAGMIFALDEKLSFYGEIAHIDDVFVSIGARYRFGR